MLVIASSSCRSLLIIILLSLIALAHIRVVHSIWPYDTLRCYSSMTKPDMQLICPEARSTYCVKEISDLKQDLCGKTQYFGDVYENSLCYFKKCSATCVPGISNFRYAGRTFVRQRFCCSTDYCNSGFRMPKGRDLYYISGVVGLAIAIIISFLQG
jgi:hypothetical protein